MKKKKIDSVGVKQGAHKNVRSDPFPPEGRLQGQELGKEQENLQGHFKEEREGARVWAT